MIIVFTSLIVMFSCKKEIQLTDKDSTQEHSIAHKDNSEIPYNIINLCSFDFDAYEEGEYVDFEEEVIDENQICYGIKITPNRADLEEWIAREEASGKTVRVYEYPQYYYNPNTHEMVRVVIFYIGISKNE